MSVYGEGLNCAAAGGVTTRRCASRTRPTPWDPGGPDGSSLAPRPPTRRSGSTCVHLCTDQVRPGTSGADLRRAPTASTTVALRLFNVFGPGQALSNPYTGVLANFAARLPNGRPRSCSKTARKGVISSMSGTSPTHSAWRCESRGRAGPRRQCRQRPASYVSPTSPHPGLGHGRDCQWRRNPPQGPPGDIRNCFADISKARDACLGFEPALRLETALGELAAWVSGGGAVDRGAKMKAELEARGLVS